MGQYTTYCGRIPLNRDTPTTLLAALSCMVSHHYPTKPNEPNYAWFKQHPGMDMLMQTAPWVKDGLRTYWSLETIQLAGYELQFCVCNKQPIDPFHRLIRILMPYITPPEQGRGDVILISLGEEWVTDTEIDKVNVQQYYWQSMHQDGRGVAVVDTQHPWDYYPGWFEPFMTHTTLRSRT